MKNKKAFAIIGESAKEDIIRELERLDFEVISLSNFQRLPSPVASHADMLMFPIDNKIFLSRDYAPFCKELLERLKRNSYDIVICDCDIKNEYPFDVCFNAARVGKNILANTKYICSDIKRYIEGSSYSLHHVKQGYTKCSTVILSENAIITADTGIAKKASELGIDVLTVNNSHDAVLLDGYDYGFLGGACGLYDGTLYFCGDISRHPDHNKILEFCNAHGVKLYSLSGAQLQDVGGIFFLEQA